MLRLRFAVFVFAALFSCLTFGEELSPIAQLAWQFGPTEAVIGDKALMKIPEGYAFLNNTETKKFMEINHNISSGQEYVLAPETLGWFAVFRFNPVGYVKDDETLDAAQVLEAVKAGTVEGNKERSNRGWSTMSIVGWRFQPQYDRQANLLEWAFVAKDDSTKEDIINYNTRLLGRTGVMEVILVADPARLDTSIGELKTTLTGYQFAAGEKYAEFQQGDRVAEFGLAALVAGGAAAVAAKKGFFAMIGAFLAAAWKFVLAGVIAAGVWLKSLFTKKN